jgi:hypothetical protein
MDVLQKIEAYLKILGEQEGGAPAPGVSGAPDSGTTTNNIAQFHKRLPFGTVRRRKKIHKTS